METFFFSNVSATPSEGLGIRAYFDIVRLQNMDDTTEEFVVRVVMCLVGRHRVSSRLK